MNTTKLPSVEDALKFMEGRRNLLTMGAASICVPYGDEPNYAPFTYFNYPHRALIGYTGNESWQSIFRQPPQDLIPVNPFTPSKARQNGLAVWDAAVGIKACHNRNAHYAVHTRNTPVLRNSNTYWRETLIPAINRVGPLGPQRKILRPQDPYIVDLTKMGDLGYRMRLAAHAIAHTKGDHLDVKKLRKGDKTKLGGFISGLIGEMVFAYIYGLPFNITRRHDDIIADADFRQYGIEVKSSTHFELPILKLPWMNNEAPRFDATIALVNVATFIEPHPYGWTSRTMQCDPDDYWCCSPTVAMIVGWELVDFITHQPLISSGPGDFDYPVGYGVHPLDMLGPDQFWSYLALAREARGEPMYTKEFRDIEEWLYSKDFDELIAKYPALPCHIDCMSWNDRAEGAPARPKQSRPRKKSDDVILWMQWDYYDKQRTQIKRIIEPVLKERDASYYGSRLEANRRRRERSRQYKLRRAIVDDERKLKRALLKTDEGKDLTNEEMRVRTAYEERVRAAKKNLTPN